MRLIDADNKEILLESDIYQAGVSREFMNGVMFMIEQIDKAPTIEAEPIKHGRWIITDQDVMGEKKLMCSYCTSVTSSFGSPNYCFNCGTKMDEVIENGK